MNIGEAAITAVLGYAVVFVGLILLMAVVVIMGRVMHRQKNIPAPHPASAAPVPAAAPAPALQVELAPAPGTAGEVKLHSVPDREAALLMAIVAHKMGKPLNELRFKSIKEVE
ncbi:MAG: OadG family protein [Oscillospiraceae bacterium]|nr:OadG family protein [Oscillospiraceae bacterium]